MKQSLLHDPDAKAMTADRPTKSRRAECERAVKKKKKKKKIEGSGCNQATRSDTATSEQKNETTERRQGNEAQARTRRESNAVGDAVVLRQLSSAQAEQDEAPRIPPPRVRTSGVNVSATQNLRRISLSALSPRWAFSARSPIRLILFLLFFTLSLLCSISGLFGASVRTRFGLFGTQ